MNIELHFNFIMILFYSSGTRRKRAKTVTFQFHYDLILFATINVDTTNLPIFQFHYDLILFSNPQSKDYPSFKFQFHYDLILFYTVTDCIDSLT